MITVGFILLGLVLLYYGGDILIAGSIRMAKHFRISPFIIGATVIGFGTSAPELAVSILASFKGAPELALGNVIGSNIANVGLVLGITAILTPLAINENRFKRETPPLLIATFLILWFVWDNQLGKIEGIILIVALILYLWRSLSAKEESDIEIEDEFKYFKKSGLPVQFGLIVVGLVMLVQGADYLVKGGVTIASGLGVSEWLIGVTIVAVGTSLPEIVSAIMSARRGHSEMALGNIFGSNIFNILMVLGTTSTIKTLNIQTAIHPDMLITTCLTCLMVVLIRFEHVLSKHDGILLLGCYISYITLKSMAVI